MFVRKTVTYAHYEMTKEEFVKDHCSGLSAAVADERWKMLCSLSKEKADEMVWLDDDEDEDADLDHDAVVEFLEAGEMEWKDEEVYSHCEKFSDFTTAEETEPYADWAFYLTTGGGPIGGYLSKGTEVVYAKRCFGEAWKEMFVGDKWSFTPMKGKTLTFYPADEMKGIAAEVIVA